MIKLLLVPTENTEATLAEIGPVKSQQFKALEIPPIAIKVFEYVRLVNLSNIRIAEKHYE